MGAVVEVSASAPRNMRSVETIQNSENTFSQKTKTTQKKEDKRTPFKKTYDFLDAKYKTDKFEGSPTVGDVMSTTFGAQLKDPVVGPIFGQVTNLIGKSVDYSIMLGKIENGMVTPEDFLETVSDIGVPRIKTI